MSRASFKLLNLRNFVETKGKLTVIEGVKDIPFEIKRVYFIYDVPLGESRGAHAHRKLDQFMLCLSGSFEVRADDGNEKKTFELQEPYEGLYIPKLVWTEMDNFSAGSVCLIMASEFYDESDYIRNYDEFLKITKDMIS